MSAFKPQRRGLLAMAALTGLLAAMGCESGSKLEGTIIAERQFLKASRASKEVGEDCSSEGQSACRSRICLHYLPADKAWVCSRACLSDSECPDGWRCTSIYPGPGNEFCLPPANWAFQIALGRSLPFDSDDRGSGGRGDADTSDPRVGGRP